MAGAGAGAGRFDRAGNKGGEQTLGRRRATKDVWERQTVMDRGEKQVCDDNCLEEYDVRSQVLCRREGEGLERVEMVDER